MQDSFEVESHPHNPMVIRRGSLRIYKIDMPTQWVDATILGSNISAETNANRNLVRSANLLTQLVAAVVLVSTSPNVYIPLGTCSFALGVVEAALEFWRAKVSHSPCSTVNVQTV